MSKYNLTAIIKDKKGNVLAIGKNSYHKTHPRMKQLGKKIGFDVDKKNFIHAEIDAIIRCKNLDKAYSIEVYRPLKKAGAYGVSRPCRLCLTGLSETNIKIMKFFDKEGNFIEELVEDALKLEVLEQIFDPS